MIYHVYFQYSDTNTLVSAIKQASEEDKFIFILTPPQLERMSDLLGFRNMTKNVFFKMPRPVTNIAHLYMGRRLTLMVLKGGNYENA